MGRSGHSHREVSVEREDHHYERISEDGGKHSKKRSHAYREETSHETNAEEYSHRSSGDWKEGSYKRHKHDSGSDRHKRRGSSNRDHTSDY